ncbi:DUF3489 domain-containing protein [Sphingomonas mucosissima]|uniref:DUF3489 domain-containing protein n=1 Tax=Sphingomonas mucosissima TaxID=370959 RepID=A0A245ZDB5_9SPHN|nr:DUF3489 domain-containing protein [Sphingomonas mucosissima]OWK27708.1 hypothetical protein SPMU_33500 [Sphingomonas mucosissima]
MPKITPMQSLLLTHAASRQSGSLFPLPQNATHPPTVRRSIAALLGRGWVKASQTQDLTAFAHLEGNARYGVFITPAGCAAIGANDLVAQEIAPQPTPQRETKAAKVIALLLRESGATLNDLTEATGWLPHTTRAALTGLRKKGHVLEKGKQPSGLTCYRIIAE